MSFKVFKFTPMLLHRHQSTSDQSCLSSRTMLSGTMIEDCVLLRKCEMRYHLVIG